MNGLYWYDGHEQLDITRHVTGEFTLYGDCNKAPSLVIDFEAASLLRDLWWFAQQWYAKQQGYDLVISWGAQWGKQTRFERFLAWRHGVVPQPVKKNWYRAYYGYLPLTHDQRKALATPWDRGECDPIADIQAMVNHWLNGPPKKTAPVDPSTLTRFDYRMIQAQYWAERIGGWTV